MGVRRAVLTAAGSGQRILPLHKVVDRDGEQKPVLRVLADEVAGAGIEQLAVVARPGDEGPYAEAIGDASVPVEFVAQPEPLGYGDALFRARSFVGEEQFLHVVSDHLFVHGGDLGCARQLVDVADQEEAMVSAVQATREHLLPRAGTIAGVRVPGRKRLYEVQRVLEKPTPTEAELVLHVPGLRAGHYLCFFGMHVLSPRVLDWIGERLAAGDAAIGLSEALDALARTERYLAHEVDGRRYDVAEKYGLFTAQLALGLAGRDRELVLARLVEVLAQRELDR